MIKALKKIFYLILLLLPSLVFGQIKNKYTINGSILDKKTGEILIGANIKLSTQSGLGAVSNAYGFYSITADEGTYTLVAGFAGFASDTISIFLTKNIELAISLNPSRSQLEEVVVNSRKKNDNITKALMGVQKLSINEIKNIPVLFVSYSTIDCKLTIDLPH